MSDKELSQHKSINLPLVKDDSETTKPTQLQASVKYVGFSLFLAFHYSLWFTPNSFMETRLLDNLVTYAWLINLASTALTMAVIALVLGRNRKLSTYKILYFAIPLTLALATLLLETSPAFPNGTTITLLSAAVLGILEGFMWILWGECLIRIKAKFSLSSFGTIFGCFLLVSVTIGILLPAPTVPLFNMGLVLISGFLLNKQNKSTTYEFPQLLPKSSSDKILINIVTISVISFITSASSYYLASIIPWEELAWGEDYFTYGIMAGGIIMIAVSLLFFTLKDHLSSFKLFPYLLVLLVIGMMLYLADSELYLPAFIIALSVYSLLEVSLIMYFATLTLRGYLAPALAFALTIASIRLGVVVGNSLSVYYEAGNLVSSFGTITALLFACMTVLLIVPLVKREPVILALTSAPSTPSEVDVICEQITSEFGLSERESEVLKLLARNMTVKAIGEKLFISPNTVSVHIRHIYDKTCIRKRNDLLDYINKRCDEK
ncbi:MAG: helix-turn-helix transcriptional regulator [Anaerotardibacter sp.]